MRLSSIGIVALLAGASACSQEKPMDKKAPDAAATQPPAKEPAPKPAEPKPAETKAEVQVAESKPADPAVKEPEPDHIRVQHLLIAFKGTLPKAGLTRTREEAKTLAYELYEKVRKGEDFGPLIKQYTDDSYPGIYAMANFGKPLKGTDEFARNRMVAAFGDTGFPLKVGEYGIADFDPKKSPFGWHIVKRIE
jgi:parvulin-like peptidyl-prolyl isomerase